jgi:hypothetical protein
MERMTTLPSLTGCTRRASGRRAADILSAFARCEMRGYVLQLSSQLRLGMSMTARSMSVLMQFLL